MRSSVTLAALIAALLVTSWPPVRGQVASRQIGPVFRTVDRGDSWTSSSQGLTGPARNLAADPIRGYLYASTTAGVFRSIDHGESWSLWFGGEPAAREPLIAVDPRDPSTVYLFGPGPLRVAGCCADSIDTSPRQAFVIRIDHDGQRRILLRTFTTPCCESESIAVSPHDGSVWLGANYALEVSFDRGQTWISREQGLPRRGPGVAPPATILFDERLPRVVFEQSIYGVAKSGDHGLSWQMIDFKKAGFIPVGLGLDPLDSNHFFVSASAGGMYVTADGGLTWDTPFGVIGQPRGIAVSPLLPFEVYTTYSYRSDKPPYGVDWTVAYSRDRGVTWGAARRPPARGDQVIADPLDADRAFSIATVVSAAPF